MDNFVVFILTHGRPDRVITYKTLKNYCYTGRIILLVDDEDPTLPDYEKKYPGEVIVFSKADIATRFDEMDTGQDKRTIVYARNACFDVAESIGVDYFLQLDDDYKEICYTLKTEKRIKNLDLAFSTMLEFYIDSGLDCLAMAQSGDMIGGKLGKIGKAKRKAMNSLFCSTLRPFSFLGRINEDVNTYVLLGSQGKLFITITSLFLNQKDTQSNDGGMTDVYVDGGTYIKSFYSVVCAPSCVKISTLTGGVNERVHHKISWRNAVPKIIREEHRKAA